MQGLTINLISLLYTICIHRSLLGNQGYDLIKFSSLYLGCDGNTWELAGCECHPPSKGSWCVSTTQDDIVWISTDKQQLQGTILTKTQLLTAQSSLMIRNLVHNEVRHLRATSAGLNASSAGSPIALRIQKLSRCRSKEVSFPDTPYLPCRSVRTVISELNWFKCALIFVHSVHTSRITFCG